MNISRLRRFNTMRLWVPHLFIILNNFDAENWTEERQPTICEMLDRRVTLPARRYLNYSNFDDTCFRVGKNHVTPRHFADNLIIVQTNIKVSILK